MKTPDLNAPDVWATRTPKGLTLVDATSFMQLLKINGTPEQLLALIAEMRAGVVESLPACDRCSRPVLPDGSHP